MARRKKTSESLTPLELDIMQVLWSEGPSSVQAVQKKLRSAFAYTTVQTVLNVLLRKGRVLRRLDGRAYVYHPTASKDSVLSQAIKDLVGRMFGGSPEELVMSLVKSRQLNRAKLEELTQRIKAADERGRDE